MTTVTAKGDGVLVALSAEDAMLLRTLATQVVAMLAPPEPAGDAADPLAAIVGMPSAEAATPQDPALHRLLPAAYDDDAAAADFRRLMDGDLRRLKSEALETLLAGVEERSLRLSADDTDTWLRALNDIRLVLGVRLDVQEDMEALVASLVADDPRLPLLYAYDRLTRLQDALLDALDPPC